MSKSRKPNLTSETKEVDGRSFYKVKPQKFVYGALLAWSLFQIWHASPLPFVFDFFILNDTEARALHLAAPLGLVFLCFPLFANSRAKLITPANLILGLIATFCAAYLFLFYEELSRRPGLPTSVDKVAAMVGIVMLLEATRRVLGPVLVLVSLTFMAYAFLGPHMPDVLAHKGISLTKAVNHYWLSTEGVFGIALGVSTSLVFMFVLFGALLEQGGAGNYFIRSAYAMMGRFRGGPGKAAVAASALTGMVSGSSTANVVTTGAFTIPLMKRVGFSAEKAGAIEVASSTNGQLMPPVMGAAAFLMAEYVGISYLDVVKHALVPALVAYFALAYIVHIEACKMGMQGLEKQAGRHWTSKLMLSIGGFVLCALVAAFVYYGLGWLQAITGDHSIYASGVLVVLTYVGLLKYACGVPELPGDLSVRQLPPVMMTLRAGCYYLLPLVLLMWCLILEQLSAALSAFWASCFMMFIVITQHPLKAWFRKQPLSANVVRLGIQQLLDGMVNGARNMVGIALATATAGIIVGTVTVTGLGFVLTELIEVLAGGSLIAVLMLTALISLVLGMGLPTTANYIVVSTLMAPVIVQLGAANGLIVPLIAAHLFVFYFGILADDTPPVGLAAYAASGLSGGDAIKTGIQGFTYDIRTALLPFLFLFNPEIIMVGVNSVGHAAIVIVCTLAGMLVFVALVQGYFVRYNTKLDVLLLIVACLILFRPGLVWDRVFPEVQEFPAAAVYDVAGAQGHQGSINIEVTGENFDTGNIYQKVVVLNLVENGDDLLLANGLELREESGDLYIDHIGFDSQAQKSGFDFDQKLVSVRASAERPSKYWLAVLGLGLVVLVARAQSRRAEANLTAPA